MLPVLISGPFNFRDLICPKLPKQERKKKTYFFYRKTLGINRRNNKHFELLDTNFTCVFTQKCRRTTGENFSILLVFSLSIKVNHCFRNPLNNSHSNQRRIFPLCMHFLARVRLEFSQSHIAMEGMTFH